MGQGGFDPNVKKRMRLSMQVEARFVTGKGEGECTISGERCLGIENYFSVSKGTFRRSKPDCSQGLSHYLYDVLNFPTYASM